MGDMNNIHLLSDEHRHYYYYGYDHLSQPMTEQPHHFQPTLNTTIPSPIEPNINQFQTGEEREVKPRTSSSASLPSHNMRWTPEEDALLLDAIVINSLLYKQMIHYLLETLWLRKLESYS
ncbi:hypothetical protein RMCBS344292_11988 [Rhizopus microsporus]|nr:hypothetical protein RMCBS344292_11988 [Rhizopus microsporus]